MIPEGREPEELAANRHVVLMSDDEGYAVWEVDTESETPLVTFPPTPEGSDDAWDAYTRATRRARIGRALRGLLWAAGILGVVWAVTTIIDYIVFALGATGHIDEDSRWLFWLPVASAIAWTVFLSASVIYVLVWLQRHPKAGRRRFRPIEP
jgi:hypothetical protein